LENGYVVSESEKVTLFTMHEHTRTEKFIWDTQFFI